MSDNRKHVILVGGGLVGSLNAVYLAKRGFKVDLFEMRPDMRAQQKSQGRSINLTLSCRGAEALRAVGLLDLVTNNGIPIKGRMIHDGSGRMKEMLYGKKDDHILSLDRRRVNELLLTAAENERNVEMHFNHKVLCCDFDKGVATFQRDSGEKVTHRADLIVGCDGAYSTVRAQMMKSLQMDFSQSYLSHAYMELRIPPLDNRKFEKTSSSHLHIWPCGKFLMLSFPDYIEQCFVTTLTMPMEMFDRLKTPKQLLAFFNKHFGDYLDFIGITEKELIDTFFSRAPLPLVSIKCKPYHHSDKGVFMGDAAHAMVPFYGQGMNCGFEDCLVFDNVLDKFDNDLSKALPEFSRIRNPDAEAIVDLALGQYTILMETVTTRSYVWRKRLDNFLHWLMPQTWIPIYTSVAFSCMPYSDCIRNRQWQNKMLKKLGSLACASLLVVSLGTAFKFGKCPDTVQHVYQKLTDSITWSR